MQDIPFSLTAADYRSFYVSRCAHKIWKFGLAVCALITALNAWSDYGNCGRLYPSDLLREGLWGFGFSAFFCLLILAMNFRGAKRIFESLNPLAVDQTVSWDEHFFTPASAFYRASYPWSLMKGLSESRQVIAVNISSVSPFLIPKRCLSTEQVEDLRSRATNASV